MHAITATPIFTSSQLARHQNEIFSLRQKKPLKARHSPGDLPGHRLPRSSWIPTWARRRRMRAENMQIHMRIPARDSSSCLTARFTHLRPEPEDLWEPCHSLFFLLRRVITIRDHKWNLSRLFRVTIGQSLRARRKGVIRCPMRAHTYAPSRGSRQLSSNSLCVPPLSFFPLRTLPFREVSRRCQRSCGRIPVPACILKRDVSSCRQPCAAAPLSSRD